MSSTFVRDRVLVTGAAGFIGSRLASRLAAVGAEVHAVVRPGSNPWRLGPIASHVHSHVMDLQDRTSVDQLMKEVAPRHIFHLATYRASDGGNYRDAYETNVFGLLHLLEAAGTSVTRFVHFASSTEYGPSPDPLREDRPLAPTTLHGVTKAAAALLCAQYARRTNFPVVVLRLFHVYGPGDRRSRLIPQLLSAALESKPLSLTPPGFRHDWTYVEDVIDASLAATNATLDPGEVINVATGQDWTNEEVRCRVEHLCGRAIEIDERPFPPRAWDSTRWVADVDKARRVLGWTAAHTLDAGLLRTIEWFHTKGELHRAP